MKNKKIYISLLGVMILYSVLWLVPKTDSPKLNLRDILLPARNVKLIAVGDLNMGRHTGQQLLKGDIAFPFAYITDYLKDADIAFGNLESQLADLDGETQSPTNEYRFAGPPEGAKALSLAGFDVVSVANNHMWDYGHTALIETWANLTKEQILFTGSQNIPEEQYKPAVLFNNGQKIAFFAITDLLNGYDRYADPYVVTSSDEDLENLIFHIKQNKKKMDWIIVSMHAGNEYQKKPSTRQKKLAHALIDSGADIIIGHHPHVPQGIERHNSGIIFYSLGNFAFWQPFEFWTQNSFVLEITLKPNHVFEYKIVPVEAGWQPKLVEDMDAQKKMIDYIAKLQI